MKSYYVYILTNQRHTTLYTGVTNDLARRIYEHKSKLIPGFTKKYNIDKLVFFEKFANINQALENEKRIKAGSRKKKEELIDSMNNQWQDLSEQILE